MLVSEGKLEKVMSHTNVQSRVVLGATLSVVVNALIIWGCVLAALVH